MKCYNGHDNSAIDTRGGASISYSHGRDPRGASVPLHPQRRDIHTIAKQNTPFINILLRKAMQPGITRKQGCDQVIQGDMLVIKEFLE